MVKNTSERGVSLLGWGILGAIIWAGYQNVTLAIFLTVYVKTLGLFGSIIGDTVDRIFFDQKGPGRSGDSIVGNFAVRMGLALVAVALIAGLVNYSGAYATIPGLASFGFAMMTGVGLLIGMTVATILVAHGTSDAFPLTSLWGVGIVLMFLNGDPEFYTLAIWFPPLIRDIVRWALQTLAGLFVNSAQAVISTMQSLI
jgi:hypothetical protein